MDILTNVLNLDEQKTTAKAAVTVFFYLSVTFALDAVLLIMFQTDPESANVLQYIQRFSPSLFIGTALTVMVLIGRVMPLWAKLVTALASVAGGLLFIGAVSILPLAYILKMPVEDEELNLPREGEEEVTHTSLSLAVRSPQDIQGEIQEADYPKPDFSSSDKGDKGDEDEDNGGEEEKKTSRLMGDGEVPDDYEDPIDDFLKDK